MKKTNFDRYLEEQMQDPAFAARFKQAGEAWDVALQIAALREQAGLSQTELARKLKTSQQQISRLESPGYEGHSLSMLRRVAKVLHARVRVVIEADDHRQSRALAEDPVPYRVKRLPPSAHERATPICRPRAPTTAQPHRGERKPLAIGHRRLAMRRSRPPPWVTNPDTRARRSASRSGSRIPKHVEP